MIREVVTRVVVPVFCGYLVAFWFTGCSSLFRSFDELNDPTDDVELSQCRREGRAARDAGADAGAAYAAYVNCTKDAGLR